MTQQDTVIKAFEHLSGEGDLDMITYMMTHLYPDVWRNTHDPRKTLRRILCDPRNKQLFASFDCNNKTWYEYLPYKQRQAQLLDEEQELLQLKADYRALEATNQSLQDENEQLDEQIILLQRANEGDVWTQAAKALSIPAILSYCNDLSKNSAKDVYMMLLNLLSPLELNRVIQLINQASQCKLRGHNFVLPENLDEYTKYGFQEPDYTTHEFAKYVPNPAKAQAIMSLLHRSIMCMSKPKQILKPLRAAMEALALDRNIPAEDFINEFCQVSTSSYSRYVNGLNAYTAQELKPLVDEFKKLL